MKNSGRLLSAILGAAAVAVSLSIADARIVLPNNPIPSNISPLSSESSVFFLDNFTGTDGTLLTAHTPDIGVGWIKSSVLGAAGDTMEIQNNASLGYARNTTGASDYATYLSSTESPSLYQKLTVTLHVNGTGAANLWGAGMQGKVDESPNAGGLGSIIMAGLHRDDGAVNRITTSDVTALTSSPTMSYAAGQNLTLTFQYDGKLTMVLDKGGTNITQVVKRNDLMRHAQASAGVAWGGPGKIFILANQAGGSYGVTTQWFKSVKGEQISPNPAYKMFGFFGNSIVRGLGTSDSSHLYYATGFPQLWLDSQSDTNVVISNTGIQAQTTLQMLNATTGDIPVAAALFQAGFAKNVAVFHEIGNDIVTNGQTGAQAYARANSWLTAMKLVCPPGTKYVITEVLPRVTAGFNTQRDAANVLINSSAISDGWDAVVQWPRSGVLANSIGNNADNPDGGPFGLNYAADGIHPNDAGAGLMWPALKAVTDTLL